MDKIQGREIAAILSTSFLLPCLHSAGYAGRSLFGFCPALVISRLQGPVAETRITCIDLRNRRAYADFSGQVDENCVVYRTVEKLYYDIKNLHLTT
jgi:hypothetical protein